MAIGYYILNQQPIAILVLSQSLIENDYGGEEMLEFNWTFVWTIVNILVLYFILNKILFKPLTAFMEKRAKNIQDMHETAKENKLEAENYKAKLKEELDKAYLEAEKIINDSKTKADKLYEETMNKAKADAKAMNEKAKREIEADRRQMLDELKSQIAGLALAAASKVIQKNMDSEANKKLVDQFIDEVGAA